MILHSARNAACLAALLALLPATVACSPHGAQRDALSVTGDLRAALPLVPLYAAAAAQGDFDASDRLVELRHKIDLQVSALRFGSPKLGLAAPTGPTAEAVESLHAEWQRSREDIESLLRNADDLMAAADTAGNIVALIPMLQAELNMLANSLLHAQAPSGQTDYAYQLLRLSERIPHTIMMLLQSESPLPQAGDRLNRDCSHLVSGLAMLAQGSETLQLEAVSVDPAREALTRVQSLTSSIGSDCDRFFSALSSMMEAREAAALVKFNQPDLNKAARDVFEHLLR